MALMRNSLLNIKYLPNHKKLRRKLRKLNIISIPGNIDTLVVSYGGVGTSFLMHYLSAYKMVNNYLDEDFLKHMYCPPKPMPSVIRIIYLYGDPILAALSIFRRNLQYYHSKKLLTINRKRISPIPDNMTIDEYASNGIDKFYFKDHFKNWFCSEIQNPILFMKYESIFKHSGIIGDFLELPKEARSDFPLQKERESSKAGLNKITLKNLNRMYGEFKQEIDCLDDYEIRNF